MWGDRDKLRVGTVTHSKRVPAVADFPEFVKVYHSVAVGVNTADELLTVFERDLLAPTEREGSDAEGGLKEHGEEAF